MGIRGEIGNAWEGTKRTFANSGRETWDAAKKLDAPAFFWNLGIEQPAKVGLNILAISTKTALRISGLLLWRTVKTGAKTLAMLPLIPIEAERESFDAQNYAAMAREAPIAIRIPQRTAPPETLSQAA